MTDTPFGQFLVLGVPDGTHVDIVSRPQHIRIDFDRGGHGPNPTPDHGVAARAKVVRARFMGNERLVAFQTQCDGTLLKAAVPSVFLPSPGTIMWLTLPRARCLVFPESAERA